MKIAFIKSRGCLFGVLLFCMAAFSTTKTAAQDARLYLDLQAGSALKNSQLINLTDILAKDGRGSDLFHFYMENENTARRAEDLYLSITMRSGKDGTIVDLYQAARRPFSLNAGQRVYATNNVLNTGIPGVQESISFDGGLTAGGEALLNRLHGSTSLPPGKYTIELAVYQGGNSKNGGALIQSAFIQIGGDIVEDVRDIFLVSPGDVVGNGAEITNPYPVFRWEGTNGVNYRLVVVEAKGQDSPESLIQGALSTAPVLDKGARATGSLLDYEIVDARLNQTSFQMPPSGVQKLEAGKVYYWQVQAEVNTSNGIESRSSEIWSFQLAAPGTQTVQAGDELNRLLKQLLSDEQYRSLVQGGFQLQSIELDGQTITGPAALQKLAELKGKLDNGDISIIHN